MSPLIRACHPEPTLAVTLVTALLAVNVGLSWSGVAAVAVAMLASQLSVGWGNDWLDADRDARVGRTDKPVAAGQVSRRTVGVAALVAGVATVPLALLSGWRAGVVLTVALVSAWSYNWPLKRTVLSPVPYLVSFAALPAFVVSALPATPPWWLMTAGALLGFGAHFANALPDLADDAATGVRGLPHRLGAAGSRVLAALGLFAASAVLAFGPPGPPTWFGWAVTATAAVVLSIGLYAGRAPGSRAAFRAVLVVALADVVLLLVS
ncbi:membrane protein [Longispora fulva]|uniref:4-hydroxybenzoate polyprenyltransferase n=1 Tax=Longispora fulva TaxID=619741 RepID=A0A8J7KJB0_9ACTN|nr:UbiA family prenyltransferase [Longispora fulva]MBG6135276.1 4-hydroxybenzoate polyprenyltransferase [Longispora fulva]GIG56485.1 membrane protein [Longispora fulva]